MSQEPNEAALPDRRYAIWTAAGAGLSAALSVDLTVYVYRRVSSPTVTIHIVDKFGQAFDRMESLEGYLFFDPFMQFGVFAMVLSIALFWKAFVRRSFAERGLPNKFFPRKGDPSVIYKAMCVVAIVISVGELIATISNAVALENYQTSALKSECHNDR